MSEFSRTFQQTATDQLARDLLGVTLCYQTPRGRVSGWIVEDEAYLGVNDPASFAYHGHQDRRNLPLYQAGGTIYLYKLYGHYVLDVVTQPVGNPQAILFRALEPAQGQDLMADNRPINGRQLTNGPAKLVEALGIPGARLTGHSFDQGPLRLDWHHRRHPRQIVTATRRGAQAATPSAFSQQRFYVAGNPYVSTIHVREIDHDQHGWQ